MCVPTDPLPATACHPTPHAGQPLRVRLRELLTMLCPLSQDLIAFCADHFPETYRRFSGQMDRVQMITLLLDCEGPLAVEGALRRAFPARCRQFLEAPIDPTDPTDPTPLPPSPTSSLPEWSLLSAEMHSRLRPSAFPVVLAIGGLAVLLLGLCWSYRRSVGMASEPRPGLMPPSPSGTPEAGKSGDALSTGRHRLYPPAAPGMICLPGGTIQQQTERGIVTVTVAPFCMDRSLVRVTDYMECLGSNRCSAADKTNYDRKPDRQAKPELDQLCTATSPPGEQLPINCINWHEANRYCTAMRKRLPNSAEWELAAGAMQNQIYPWGFKPPSARTVNGCDAGCVAWAEQRGKLWRSDGALRVLLRPRDRQPSDRLFAEDDGFPTVSPVLSKPASLPYGFDDLSGNLRQWMNDQPNDCQGPACPPLHILKGGSWGDVRKEAFQISGRAKAPATLRSDMHGFRCAQYWWQDSPVN